MPSKQKLMKVMAKAMSDPEIAGAFKDPDFKDIARKIQRDLTILADPMNRLKEDLEANPKAAEVAARLLPKIQRLLEPTPPPSAYPSPSPSESMSSKITHDGNDVVTCGSPPFDALKSANVHVREIAFETNISRIGAQACSHCVQVIEVTIPEGVESIGDNAFMGCRGNGVFANCPELVPSDIDPKDTDKVAAYLREGDGNGAPTPKASNVGNAKGPVESPQTDTDSPAPSSTFTSPAATPSPNLMLPKKFEKSRTVSALADRVNNSMQSSLTLSRTPARRPYRGAIPVKKGNTWNADDEDEDDENEEDQENVDMQARGKDDDDDSDEELVARKKSPKKKKKTKRKKKTRGGRSRYSSESEFESEEEDANARTLPPGGLENMVDFLAVTGEDDMASDSSDDEAGNVDPMSDVIISESTSVFVANPIPVGDEWFYVQGDSDDSDQPETISGRRKTTSKYYARKKKKKAKKKKKGESKDVSDDSSSGYSSESQSSDSDAGAKSSGEKSKRKKKKSYNSSDSDDDDNEVKAEAK
ncbi:hypothetical protein TrST_g7348 [Triparma strigata]|uniref:Uncharacterized protein n=1 Tax=Triparma strigata TaxID=1606541 RepID=A0A9W7BEA3_9STRA|nr:hypothetical protein TrST_g7348 [Triparma strigata]